MLPAATQLVCVATPAKHTSHPPGPEAGVGTWCPEALVLRRRAGTCLNFSLAQHQSRHVRARLQGMKPRVPNAWGGGCLKDVGMPPGPGLPSAIAPPGEVGPLGRGQAASAGSEQRPGRAVVLQGLGPCPAAKAIRSVWPCSPVAWEAAQPGGLFPRVPADGAKGMLCCDLGGGMEGGRGRPRWGGREDREPALVPFSKLTPTCQGRGGVQAALFFPNFLLRHKRALISEAK